MYDTRGLMQLLEILKTIIDQYANVASQNQKQHFTQ